jgi:hypothetical protein
MADQPIQPVSVCVKCRGVHSVDAEGEEWRDIENYEGLYQVSNTGRVRSLCRRVVCAHLGRVRWYCGRVLSARIMGAGYLMVSLSRGGNVRGFYVHRLVCLAFHGAPQPGQEVDHGDGDRTNAHSYNLRWATSAENAQDKVLHGTHNRGERSPVALLSWSDVHAIRTKTSLTHREAAALYGVARETVRHIRANRAWKHH